MSNPVYANGKFQLKKWKEREKNGNKSKFQRMDIATNKSERICQMIQMQ